MTVTIPQGLSQGFTATTSDSLFTYYMRNDGQWIVTPAATLRDTEYVEVKEEAKGLFKQIKLVKNEEGNQA